MTIRLPIPCLVVLVGPSGSGKTTWAEAQFREGQVVSSDHLRALVGEGPHDQRASTAAFDLLGEIVQRRLSQRLVTVVDTLGLDAEARSEWLRLAQASGVACFAVGFDTPAKVCRERNQRRGRPVPAAVLTKQIKTWETTRDALGNEGFGGVLLPDTVRLVSPQTWRAAGHQSSGLRFGLQLSSFDWEGRPVSTSATLAGIARRAEDAGFESLWVMDHFQQIPQVGRPWEDMLESYTTLAYLAGLTERIKLGTLVTGVTYRNPAHLAKIIATLDVLSSGRAMCGLGAAWAEAEHIAYGWDFPSTAERYHILEDVLELLPLMWGPGAPAFSGRVVKVPEATCYPRPIQDKIPILVGGSGEKRTLRLVAQYADACNLFGDAATIRRKIDVLHAHCADVGRDPEEITVTHLGPALAASEDRLPERVEAQRKGPATYEATVTEWHAGTVEDHAARYSELAQAGVQTAIVGLAAPDDPETIPLFAEVISALG